MRNVKFGKGAALVAVLCAAALTACPGSALAEGQASSGGFFRSALGERVAPIVPVDPATPDNVSVADGVPKALATPEAPSVPDTPATPEAPAVSESPAASVAPATPGSPAVPEAPATPEVPAAPAAPETPAAPEDPEPAEPLTTADITRICREALEMTDRDVSVPANVPLMVIVIDGHVWVYEAPALEEGPAAAIADAASAVPEPLYQDGTYTFTGFADGHEATPTVTIKDGKIESISLDVESRGTGLGAFKANKLISAIIAAQGVEGVDTADVENAGAIIAGIELALGEARGEIDFPTLVVYRSGALARRLAQERVVNGALYSDNLGTFEVEGYTSPQDPDLKPPLATKVTWVVADKADLPCGAVVSECDEYSTVDGWWFPASVWDAVPPHRATGSARFDGETPTLADGTPICDPAAPEPDPKAQGGDSAPADPEPVWVVDAPASDEVVWVVDAPAQEEQVWVVDVPGTTTSTWVVTGGHWEGADLWRCAECGAEISDIAAANSHKMSTLSYYYGFIVPDTSLPGYTHICQLCGELFASQQDADDHPYMHADAHVVDKVSPVYVEDGYWEQTVVPEQGHWDTVVHEEAGHWEVVHHDEVGHWE